MTIKHLVLSGGGPAGLLTYGAAKHLAKTNFWHLKNIKTIYGTSIGSYMGVVFSLGYEWEWLDDYFIKRPWDKLVELNPLAILEVYNDKGLLSVDFIKATLEPLFTAKNLSTQVSMKELFEFNNISIHIYTTEINGHNLEKVCISHHSYPDLPVITALAMSMAYPFAFKPVCIDDKCYIDGGLLNNYPLRDCIEETKCDMNEILSFKNVWVLDECKVNTDSNAFDFLLVILRKMKREIDTEEEQGEIKNTVRCVIEDLDGLPSWLNALSTETLRKKLIERGEIQATVFSKYISMNEEEEEPSNSNTID
jgi:predicted acylesterase/phospholipase RssA